MKGIKHKGQWEARNNLGMPKKGIIMKRLRIVAAVAALVAAMILGVGLVFALAAGKGPPWVSSGWFPLTVALVAMLYIAAALLVHGFRTPCPRCGNELSFWQRQFSGCPRCQPSTAFGFGTVLTIGFVVSFFLRSDLVDLRSGLSGLRSSADELKKASDIQAKEIQELRRCQGL